MIDVKRKLADNIKRVQDRIAQACAAAGRDPAGVRLVAVTKYISLDLLKLLPDLGLGDIGESRVQELAKRAATLNEFLSRRPRDPAQGAVPRPTWHLVGHLQRNKVRAVLPWSDMIHSVDSLRLAEEIDTQANAIDRRIDILLQVNASGEAAKHGVAVGAAAHLAEQVATLHNVSVVGLMTMAPLTEDRPVIEACFTRCRELFEEIANEVRIGQQFRHLSMGMSNDYEIAVACGATMVRIGSALYEGLDLPAAHASTPAESM